MQTQNSGIDAESLSAIFKSMRDAISTIEYPDDRDDVSHAISEFEAATQAGYIEIVQQRRTPSPSRRASRSHREQHRDQHGYRSRNDRHRAGLIRTPS